MKSKSDQWKQNQRKRRKEKKEKLQENVLYRKCIVERSVAILYFFFTFIIIYF